MAKVKVEIKGIDSLLHKFDNIRTMDLTNKVNKITALVHGQAKSLAPNDKGDLGESIHMEVKKLPDKIQGRVYTNLEYAPYVEFGTGIKGNGTYPYKIKGVNLTYKNKAWFIPASKISEKTAEKYHFKKITGKGGTVFYMTYGQEAQPFMYPAIRRNRKKMKEMMSAGVKDSLREICKGGK